MVASRDRNTSYGTIHVCVERSVEAFTGIVYGYLADLRVHHPQFLPSPSGFEVESGGVGDGTFVRFEVTAGGGLASE